MAKASGLFGGGIRLSAQRMLTPEEKAAQQVRSRRSMGEMASGLPSASPLFGGQMMRELPQQKQQQPPPPQAKPPSMWDDISQDPLAFLLSGTNGIAKRRDAVAAEAQRQQILEQARAAGLDPRAMLALELNPAETGKYLAEGMKPQTSTFYDTGTNQWNQKPQDLMSVAEGTDIYDPNTGKSAYTNTPAVKAPEGFSLNPGEVRFDSTGKRIAGVAPLPREGMGKPTPMQTAVDKNWADDLVNWQINGSANFGKQMVQLEGAVKRLKGGEELSGPGTTFLPGITRDWFGQAGKDVQQQIQETMQSSLKEVLGGQFAQKEGEGILARVFDPTLEEGVNAQRAERLMTQLKLAADQKNKALEYYNQNGTMNGYQGKVPSEADFVAAMNFAPANVVVAPNGKQFPKEQATALRNFMSSLPANMQDPQFIARLDAALSPPSAAPGQQANAPPAGVSREEWNAMTPEEKALFQ